MKIQTPAATWAQIGLTRLALRLIVLDAIVLIVATSLYAWLGLRLQWSADASAGVGVLILLLGLWLYYHFVPGTATENLVAEVIFVFILSITFVNIVVLSQYAGVALRFPYADWWLAAADERLGIHLPALVRWTTQHPAIALVLGIAYLTHMPQFVLAVFGLGALRERDSLWEFAFHFQVCLLISLIALAIWPAACPPAYWGFTPTIDLTRTMQQIQGFHTGSMTVVRFDELEGLVSLPSFHVAGGLIVTWAFRRHPRIFIPLIVVNSLMTAATFMSGLHYVIDVIASLPMFAASLALYKWWGNRLYRSSAFVAPLPEARRREETAGKSNADERPADLEQVAGGEP